MVCNRATLFHTGQTEILIYTLHQKARMRTLLTKKVNITPLPLTDETELYIPLGNHIVIVFGVGQFHRKF